jgi:hypothetical protein
MTPERKQAIEAALYEYYTDQGAFRTLTSVEYDWEASVTADLPQDSVASARIDGMPHMAVGMISDPTVRIVLTRERIEDARRAVMDAQLVAIREQLDALMRRMVAMANLWAVLDPVDRKLIEWRYFPSEAQSHPPSLEDLAQMFRQQEQSLRHVTTAWIPVHRHDVAKRLSLLLEHIEAVWYPV